MLRLREVQGGYIADEKDGFELHGGQLVQFNMVGTMTQKEIGPIRTFKTFANAGQENVAIDENTGALISNIRLAKNNTYGHLDSDAENAP